MSLRPRKSVNSPQPALGNGMKGNLILKSSPFAPTQNSLNSQYLVLDHMNAHYKKVSTAKSAIDTSVPKAWLVSQKVRDQNRRTQQKKSKSRPASGAKSRPPTQMLEDDDEDDFDPDIGTSRDEMALIKNLIHENQQEREEEEARAYGKNTFNADDTYNARRQPTTSDMHLLDRMINDSRHSPSSYKSPRPMASNIPDWTSNQGSMNNTQIGTPRRKQGGDLLETRGHKFTEPQKMFTPRTLKSTKSSKLTQYKYYNPPPKKQVHKRGGVDLPVRGETPTDTFDLMDETLQSRDFSRLKQSGTVPPLDISLDADHMKWLKEQEKNAQVRVRGNMQHGNNLEADGNQRGSHMQVYGAPRKDQSNSYLDMTGNQQRLESTAGSRKHFSRSNSTTMQRVKDEEDELKYLEFIKEVTNDVLERGIFTNRVLKQVFEHHIDKRKHDLKISRMRALVDTLREDLGIPAEDGTLESEDVGMGNTTVPPLVKPRSTTNSSEYISNNEDDFDKDYLKLATRLQLEGGLDGSSSFNSQKNFETNTNNNNINRSEYMLMNGDGRRENSDYSRMNGEKTVSGKSTHLSSMEYNGGDGYLSNFQGTYDRLQTVSEEVTPELTPKAAPRRTTKSPSINEENKTIDGIIEDDKPKPSPRPRPRLQRKKTIEEIDDDGDDITKIKELASKEEVSTEINAGEDPMDSDELLKQVSDKLSELKSDSKLDDVEYSSGVKDNIGNKSSNKRGANAKQSSIDSMDDFNEEKNDDIKDKESPKDGDSASAAKDNDTYNTSDFDYSEDEDQDDDKDGDRSETAGKSTARSQDDGDDDDF